MYVDVPETFSSFEFGIQEAIVMAKVMVVGGGRFAVGREEKD